MDTGSLIELLQKTNEEQKYAIKKLAELSADGQKKKECGASEGSYSYRCTCCGRYLKKDTDVPLVLFEGDDYLFCDMSCLMDWAVWMSLDKPIPSYCKNCRKALPPTMVGWCACEKVNDG